MKHPALVLFCAAAVAFSFAPETCRAHSVNVFAFVDGDEIRVECGFSKKRKVHNGRIVVTDARTGEVIDEGVTDGQGVYRFRPTARFLATGHGLNIRLHAGAGHQDDWKMAAEDLRALSPAAPPPAAPPGGGEGEVNPDGGGAAPAPAPGTGPGSGLAAAELEARLERMLDAKLAPLNRALARSGEREPELRDIIGGLGWIMGLLGLATYFRHRPRADSGDGK